MIFLNGALVSEHEAAIDPADRGFLLGDGLFETLRVYKGRVPLLPRHLERLKAGAAALGIPLPATDLSGAVSETLAANGLELADAAIRITLTRGPGPRGLLPPDDPKPTVMVVAMPRVPAPAAPATAVTARSRRNEQTLLTSLKTLNYLDNILARREAAAEQADEAIFWNTAGRLAGASAANLFLLRGRTLFTPPPAEGVLPGIMRAGVLDLAETVDVHAVQTPLAPAKLHDADEAFLTNSLIGIRPLVRIDQRVIGDGRAGPVTRQLQQALRDWIAALAPA